MTKPLNSVGRTDYYKYKCDECDHWTCKERCPVCGLPTYTQYEMKFPKLIEAIQSKDVDIILVPTPETLGDTYEEICESLHRIYAAGKRLGITIPVTQS